MPMIDLQTSVIGLLQPYASTLAHIQGFIGMMARDDGQAVDIDFCSIALPDVALHKPVVDFRIESPARIAFDGFRLQHTLHQTAMNPDFIARFWQCLPRRKLDSLCTDMETT